MAQRPDYTLVIACYNEAEHLEKSVATLIATLDQIKYSYELIFIDDKSRDATLEVLKQLEKKHSNRDFRFFYHTKNAGRGGTVAEGIKKASSPIVGFIDIDLEVSPVYISEIIRILHTTDTDLVLGLRYYPFKLFPPNYLLREILSRGYVWFTQHYLQHPISDTETGYKFFKKDKIMPLLARIEDTHWFWDTEIVVRSYLHGLTIKEIPVLFLRRTDKTSTVKIIPDTIAFLKAARKFYMRIEEQYGQAPGLLYKSPKAYKFAMQKIFGKAYSKRYKAIAKLLPEKSFVLDVCCGDAELYSYLKHKNITYHGFDISLPFVRSNLLRGIKTTLGNLETDPLVNADYIVMQGSLFQFKDQDEIVSKLLSYAKYGVVISESVQNLKESSFFNPFARILMPYIVSTHHDKHFRFSNETFKQQLAKFSPEFITIEGGRDLIAVIKK